MTQNLYPPTRELAEANVIERVDEASEEQDLTESVSASGVSHHVEIHEGERVFTADNHKIGTVKEVGTQYFKVHAPLRKDYWLDQNLVISTTDEDVYLNVSKGDLDPFKLDHPAVEDALLDNEDQLRQRRKMEEELAAQSAALEAEQEQEGTPIYYNEAGDRVAAVDVHQDGDTSMAELRSTERGPDPQFEPARFNSDADVDASRRDSGFSFGQPKAVGLDQDLNAGSGIRDGGPMPHGPEARELALRDYAERLRAELRHVEAELSDIGSEGTRRD
jgi:hypothetical protein